MKEIILTAIGLVLILEGIMPFAFPQAWRNMMQKMSLQDDMFLRVMGFITMLIGLIILFLVHHGYI